MKRLTLLFGMVMAVSAVLCEIDPPNAQESVADLVEKSDIVFVGKVVRTNGSSMRLAPSTDNLIEVEVETVLDKPAALTLSTGDKTTIAVKTLVGLEPGTRATFYALGWIVGDQLAVREVGHRVLANEGHTTRGPDTRGVMENRQQIERVHAELAEAQLRRRLEAADLVVVGRVSSIGTATLAATRGDRLRVSEHDPDWREATIVVESLVKGPEGTENVVVRFPASMDAAWYGVPKLKEGQEGTFVLNKDNISGTVRALTRGGAEVDAFTAIEPGDVLPKEDAERIRGLIEE